MPRPRVLILRAPGTNCDGETAFAFELAGGLPQAHHVQELLKRPALLKEFQILCLPGGFSYGDDLGAGTILGNQIRHHLADCLAEFREAGKLILGICNGFQILLRSGLLIEPDRIHGARATLTNNASGKFEDRWVRLAALPSKCVFFTGASTLYLPVAHAEGRFVARSPEDLRDLNARGQFPLRYIHQSSDDQFDTTRPEQVAYPDNPNGSQLDVAGICDSTGRICGLMPHPERHVDATQHPRWTRHPGPLPNQGEGLQIFQNGVRYFT